MEILLESNVIHVESYSVMPGPLRLGHFDIFNMLFPFLTFSWV